MKRLILLSLVLLLSACTTQQYSVKKIGGLFSENKNDIWRAKDNLISTKSIAGGDNTDQKGVYLNPYAEKKPGSSDIVLLGLIIKNKTDLDTAHGGANQLGTIQKVTFTWDDGESWSLQATAQEQWSNDDDVAYDPIGSYDYYDLTEAAFVPLTREQFRKLADVFTYSCKITGTKQSVEYKKKDITDSFKRNIAAFYQLHVREIQHPQI